jgi:hypothetical protein
MRYFTFKKRIRQDISKKLRKFQRWPYSFSNKNQLLAILREEASESLLPVYQGWKILKIHLLGNSIFSDPKLKKKVVVVFFVIFSIKIPQTLGSTAKIEIEETRKVCAAINSGMLIIFVFLCPETFKNKLILEKVELKGDCNEMEHTICCFLLP